MKFLNNLTLGKKITLLTALGVILSVGVFGFLGMRAVNQSTEMMLQDRLTTAHLVADYLDEALGRALTEVESTAQTIDVGETKDKLTPQIQSLQDNYSRLSITIHQIYLLDEEGRVIWSQPDSLSLIGTSFPYYSNNNRVMSSENSISGLFPAPLAGTPVVLLASPTEPSQQGKVGMFVVAVDPSQSSIGGFVRPLRLGQTGYVEIVEENGVVGARTEPGPKLAPFEKSDHSGRFAALIAANKPTRGVCHTCHETLQKTETRDVLAFVPLTKAHWGVVVRQSETEALAPIRDLRRNLILFGGGLIIIALFFVAMTMRDIVSRIRLLTVASQRIARGDLSHQIAATRGDEVGVLGTALEDMRAKLKASYNELEQRTKELSALLSVSEILSSLSNLSDLDTALGAALDKTLEIMRQDTGGILLLNEENQTLHYQVGRGLSDRFIGGMNLKLGEGIAGKVAQTGEAMLSEDISSDPHAAHPALISADGLRAFASVPLLSKGSVLGVLNITSHETHKFAPEDIRLLEGIARQIATAIENARLHQEVQHKDEIRSELLREMFSIQEEERRRIARELHDETSQVLASLNASLEVAASMLPSKADNIKSMINKAQALSLNILDEIHRLIYELRPTLLDDLGLVAATRWLADSTLQAAGIKASFKTIGREKRLLPQLEATLFRVIQEAVANILRHAHAQNTDVVLHFKRGAIAVQVTDDGQGFDVKEAISSKDRPRGLGLLGMKERVELMNGTLSIRSRSGVGTKISIEIPLQQEVINGQDKNTGGR